MLETLRSTFTRMTQIEPMPREGYLIWPALTACGVSFSGVVAGWLAGFCTIPAACGYIGEQLSTTALGHGSMQAWAGAAVGATIGLLGQRYVLAGEFRRSPTRVSDVTVIAGEVAGGLAGVFAGAVSAAAAFLGVAVYDAGECTIRAIGRTGLALLPR